MHRTALTWKKEIIIVLVELNAKLKMYFVLAPIRWIKQDLITRVVGPPSYMLRLCG